MNVEIIRDLLAYIKKLVENQFTGKIVLNFHKGGMSKKISKEESIDLE